MSHTEKITSRMVSAMKIVLSRHPHVKQRKDFAAKLKVSRQVVSKWESKKQNCTLEQGAISCEVFGFSADWMISGKGNLFNGTQEKTRLDKLENRLANLEKIAETIKVKKR